MARFGILGLILLLSSACSTAPDQDGRQVALADWLAASIQLFAVTEGGGRRAGSGVVLALAEEGTEAGGVYLVTAGHLLRPGSDEKVFAVDPRSGIPRPATVVALDQDVDVAILQVEGLVAKAAALRNVARLGDDVWVVSFPWGRRGTLVTGIVSQVAGGPEEAPETRAIPIEGPVRLIDAAVSYGTSGGGVFHGRSGRLVGIVRGYRTAKLALPGEPANALEFPIAGETTVVPTATILCVFAAADLKHVIPGGNGRARNACPRMDAERADAGS